MKLRYHSAKAVVKWSHIPSGNISLKFLIRNFFFQITWYFPPLFRFSVIFFNLQEFLVKFKKREHLRKFLKNFEKYFQHGGKRFQNSPEISSKNSLKCL